MSSQIGASSPFVAGPQHLPQAGALSLDSPTQDVITVGNYQTQSVTVGLERTAKPSCVLALEVGPCVRSSPYTCGMCESLWHGTKPRRKHVTISTDSCGRLISLLPFAVPYAQTAKYHLGLDKESQKKFVARATELAGAAGWAPLGALGNPHPPAGCDN